MNKEETYSEKRTREISEQANPYDKNCPNRHLWSEGFRTGYIHAKNIVTNLLKEDMKLEAEITDAQIEKEALILAKKHAKQSVGDFAVGFNWGAKYVKNHPVEKEVSDVPVIKGGWECPRCGQINAIWKSVCDCPPRTITSTTVNGTFNNQ